MLYEVSTFRVQFASFPNWQESWPVVNLCGDRYESSDFQYVDDMAVLSDRAQAMEFTLGLRYPGAV